jgi:hypothetical protein
MSLQIYPPIADYALLSDCHSGLPGTNVLETTSRRSR